MEICNKELLTAQSDLVKEYQEFQRELQQRVSKEALEYKKLLSKSRSA